VDELKAEIRRLRKTERELRKEKAAEIRELQETINTYANQIQALALRNAELAEDARKLRSQVDEATRGTVLPLKTLPGP
jgi:DNA-binding protein H-NS